MFLYLLDLVLLEFLTFSSSPCFSGFNFCFVSFIACTEHVIDREGKKSPRMGSPLEVKNAQYVVFHISSVPTSDSCHAPCVASFMSVRLPALPKELPPAIHFCLIPPSIPHPPSKSHTGLIALQKVLFEKLQSPSLMHARVCGVRSWAVTLSLNLRQCCRCFCCCCGGGGCY